MSRVVGFLRLPVAPSATSEPKITLRLTLMNEQPPDAQTSERNDYEAKTINSGLLNTNHKIVTLARGFRAMSKRLQPGQICYPRKTITSGQHERLEQSCE